MKNDDATLDMLCLHRHWIDICIQLSLKSKDITKAILEIIKQDMLKVNYIFLSCKDIGEAVL